MQKESWKNIHPRFCNNHLNKKWVCPFHDPCDADHARANFSYEYRVITKRILKKYQTASLSKIKKDFVRIYPYKNE